jgi:hypothetical protein
MDGQYDIFGGPSSVSHFLARTHHVTEFPIRPDIFVQLFCDWGRG